MESDSGGSSEDSMDSNEIEDDSAGKYAIEVRYKKVKVLLSRGACFGRTEPRIYEEHQCCYRIVSSDLVREWTRVVHCSIEPFRFVAGARRCF